MNKSEKESGKQQQQLQGSADTHAKYIEQSKLTLEGALRQYDQYKVEYNELQHTLLELPNEVEYDAMVPVGPLAFFPGKIIDTNEIMVLLGDNWFVARSAKEAAGISKRREEFVDLKIAGLRKELQELNNRKNLVAKNSDIAQVLGAEMGGDVVNEDGEKVIDIKEDLAEGQLPAFSAPANEATDGAAEPSADIAASLEEKRARVISSLSRGDKVEEGFLGTEERELMDMLYRLEEEEQTYEEGDGQNEDSSSSEVEESDEGDAFSDEDRIHAARDDDEDDYNDDFKLRVVENTRSSATDTLRGMSSLAPKGILKSSATTSLFKDRATKARSSKEHKKSVGFHPTAVSHTKANQDLLDESNGDEDVNRMTELLGLLSGPSAAKITDKHPTSGVPHISAIHEDTINKDAENGATSLALKEIKSQKPTAVRKFKPNVEALSGARSKKLTAGEKGSSKGISSSDGNRVPKKSAVKVPVDGQPLKSSVVENRPVIHDEVTQDMVDEEMHAREIAQAYNRMRYARMSTGQFDGAAETAEKILSETAGVTFIDPKPEHTTDDDEEYERIEIPAEPSGSLTANDILKPPEVIHEPKRVPASTQSSISRPPPAEDNSNAQTPHMKPKISRFKARRLGLDNSEA